jgi:hypothetical protein
VPAVLAGAPVVGLLLLAKVAPKAFAARAVLTGSRCRSTVPRAVAVRP